MAKSGIELEERDPELHPGDDLYLHMNGRWIERSDIPADKARYGAFTVLAEEAEKAVLDIIERSGDVDASTECSHTRNDDCTVLLLHDASYCFSV